MNTLGEPKAAVEAMLDDLVMGFRFVVFFFPLGAAPNPIDIRFQRVSGLISSELELTTVHEGGQNVETHRRPGRVKHGTLVLERGLVVGSLLNLEVNASLTLRRVKPSNVMVMLLSAAGAPIAAWLFLQAIPIRWSCGDLDANSDHVLVDTLELAYKRMQPLRL